MSSYILDSQKNAPNIPSTALFTHTPTESPNEPSSFSTISYESPPPIFFTPTEILLRNNGLTKKSTVDAVVYHHPGVIIEMPLTGIKPGMAIAHVFPVDAAKLIHPKDNVQYSLGGSYCSQHETVCLLLRDKDNGKPVKCMQGRFSCCSVKRCSFNSSGDGKPFISLSYNSWGEVFMKTLGFFCTLQEHRCSFRRLSSKSSEIDDSDLEQENTTSEFVCILRDVRSPRKPKACKGKVILRIDRFGHYYIRCEYFSKGERNHLRLRNLNEYNVEYLVALFAADFPTINKYETGAAKQGYGPLVPCSITSVNRAQRELCPNWHRSPNGLLQRGVMQPLACQCRFNVFMPNDLVQCPQIVIVSTGPHSHGPVPRTKTPEAIKVIFNNLLLQLGVRLADATPRRIVLDGSFMNGLRDVLGWTKDQYPGLGDLHPSLANLDHTARIINDLRQQHYPEGAQHFLEKQKQLPTEKQYLRCIKKFEDSKEGTFWIIVCMLPEMSGLLLESERPTINTSFKRLQNWREFEIEAWFPQYERSIVVTRAFTTSESAIAHHSLFKLIFQIAEADTGQAVRFRHIHGNGIDTITADGHRGQALGLGLYLQQVSKDMHGYCPIQRDRSFHQLTPLEHLSRCYRYCFAHYTRNVAKFRGQVDEAVISAMMSLASAEPLPDFHATLEIIRRGGKKAIDWLKDKQSNDGFNALAAIYWPASKIPLESWRAAPSTTNGNKQAHRNINRDGTRLSLLSGIMSGLQFDSRVLGNVKILIKDSIQPRDKPSTHFQRSLRGVKAKTLSQQKNVQTKDKEIAKLVDKAAHLQTTVASTVVAVKRTGEHPADNRQVKRLKKFTDDLQATNSRLDELIPQGSGSVSLTHLEESTSLFENFMSYIENDTTCGPYNPGPSRCFAPQAISPALLLSPTYSGYHPDMDEAFYDEFYVPKF